jgi:Ca2+-transporting ATPase
MSRKPRNPNEKIFNKKTLVYSILQGLFLLLVVALVFYLTLNVTNDEYKARALSFCTLIFSNLFLILSNRSLSEPIFKIIFKKNKAFWFVVIGALVFLGLSLYAPFLRETFKFSALYLKEILIALGAAGLSLFGFEIMKYVIYCRNKNKI